MRKQIGQSLIEVILVIFLFGLLGTGLVATLITSAQSSKRGVEHTVATGYITEGIEAVRSLRDRDWSELVNGTHGLTTAAGYYDFAGTSNSLDGGVFTRTITIEDVYRTGSLMGDISASGTVFDAASKRVIVNVTWQGTDQQIKSLDSVFYVFNWDQEVWVQSLTDEFDAGAQNSTDVTTASNGEVTLRTHDSDWDEIEVQYALDLVGGGDRIALYADPDGDVLYVLADNNAGNDFQAVNIDDVSENSPTVIAGYEIQEAHDFVVEDGYAYIAADESGPGAEIVILEVPSMTFVAVINLDESVAARGVDLYNNTLVVVREEDGDQNEMVFYNVSIPSSPVLMGGADVGITFNDVAYNGTYAIAISDQDAQEVTAIRQSDYSIVDTLNLSGSGDAEAIDMVGNDVYVGRDNGTDDVVQIDASDPSGAGLSVVDSLEVDTDVERLQVDTNQDYVMLATRDDDRDLVIVELAGLTQANVGDAGDGGDAESVGVFGAHAYTGSTNDSEDVSVYRVSPGGWGNVSLISTADLSGNHDEAAVWIDGNYVYLATENNGSNDDFFIYDISTPTTPTYLGSLDSNTDVNDLVVSGDYVYMATKDNSKEVVVIDVSTKTSPVEVESFNAAGSRDGISVAVSGDYLYLGREDGSDPELYVLEIEDPDELEVEGSLEFAGDLERLVVSGAYLYAATDHDTKELTVFDISDEEDPDEVGGLDLSDSQDAQAIGLSGSTLVIGRDSGTGPELLVINVSTPTSPTLIGSAELASEISGLFMEGTSFVHLATDVSQAQYQRWDLTTPSSPTLNASYDLEEDGEGVYFDGVYAYIGTEVNDKELQIVGPGSPPTDYAREGNFTSQPFDAGADVSWDSIEWSSSGTGTIGFRIRTADSQANLATATWVGTGGSPQTAYTTSGQSLTADPGATGERWFQWKAYLIGDGISTPILEDVTIRYSQ